MATISFESLAGLTTSKNEISEVLFGYRINNHVRRCYDNHIVLILEDEPSALGNKARLNQSYITLNLITCQLLKIINRIHDPFATLSFIRQIISKICRVGTLIHIVLRLFDFLKLIFIIVNHFFILLQGGGFVASLLNGSCLSLFFFIYSFFGWLSPHKLRGHLVFFLKIKKSRFI